MSTKEFYGDIEYVMDADTAKTLLKSRKGADASMNPQKYLCKLVNEEYGIKGNCVKVTTK